MRKRTGQVNQHYVLQVLTSCQIRREEKLQQMECQLKRGKLGPKGARTLAIHCLKFSIWTGVDNLFCPGFGSCSLQVFNCPTIQGKRGESVISNCEPGSKKASSGSDWNLKIWTNTIKLNFRNGSNPELQGILRTSVEQGFQKPQGYTGKGLEGRGQGRECLTPH